MATVNYIRYSSQSATALSKVSAYVAQERKTVDRESGMQLVSGINCPPQFAVQEFRASRAAHHKKSPVWFYHYTQSFSPNEPVTGPQAHEVAKEFAERAWPDSQVLVATHVDARHIHSHFIVNAVCFDSGYMLRQGPTTLKRLRKLSDEICQARGLSILPPSPPRHSKEPGTREYRSMEKNESWKMQLMLTIEDAMARSRMQELENCVQETQAATLDFQRELEQSAKTAAKSLSSQAGKVSDSFSRSLSSEREQMKKYSAHLFWISLIPSAALIILEVILRIWPQILPG